MDTKSPKDRLLMKLRKGHADQVAQLIKQFPGKCRRIELMTFERDKKNGCSKDSMLIFLGD